MICRLCQKRHAPRYYNEWNAVKLRDGEGIRLEPLEPRFAEEWQELYDNDILVPCDRCSL